MATTKPFTLIPAGSFPLQLTGLGEAAEAGSAEGGKKRKRGSVAGERVYGLRYNFKPASITADTPGALYAENGSRQLKFDLSTGGQQVFDAREELGKARECVLIWDDSTQSFSLHPLSSTLHLTLNRSASSTTASAASVIARAPGRAGSTASSSSSSGAPLALTSSSAQTRATGRASRSPLDPVPSAVPVASAGPSQPAAKSGKTLPRKQPLAHAALPAVPAGKKARAEPAAGRGKKAAPAPKGKGGTKAGSGTSGGKVKSSEIIDDSDEEAAGFDMADQTGPGGEEEEDEFAKLVGQSLAQGEDEGGENNSEDEDEYEEEDDDGGEDEDAAVGSASVVLDDDGSEWL